MTATTDKWQAIMDAAYDKWNDAWSYERFLEEITGTERQAVLIGNLNYQVDNGGIQQYVDNGYATQYHSTVEILRSIGTEITRTVANKLEAFCDAYVNPDVTTKRGAFGDYWNEEAQLEDGDTDPIYEHDGDAFDDHFYAVSDAFDAEIEAYFASKS